MSRTTKGDPLSQGLLLRKSEGKVLQFEITMPQTGEKRIIEGRILRSGYVPHTSAFQRYGNQYQYRQMAYANPQSGGQPIIEVAGKIQFGLPGKPIFDALDPKAFLKPTLLWRLLAADAGEHNVEFSYLSGGMRWEASYNAIAPEEGDSFDIIGWVTLENMSGRDFENARVKLMAGDVARVQSGGGGARYAMDEVSNRGAGLQPAVTERSFEEYHLSTLSNAPRPCSTARSSRSSFLRASNVPRTAHLCLRRGSD